MSCPEKFRPDEDEQLIELVHANPCLWNISDPDFKKEKRFIWEDIGGKLPRRPRSGVECKSRWRSIRDYYKKQKKDEKNGVPAIKRRQVYWNSLKFLGDVDEELKALTNVHVEITEETEDLDVTNYQDYESDICESTISSVPTKKRKLEEKLPECVDGLKKPWEKGDSENKVAYCKQTEERIDFTTDITECQLKEKFNQIGDFRVAQDMEVKSIASDQDRTDDEIDLFFKAMAATVKKFPPNLKVVSKARIFSVVNELEVKYLEFSSQCQSFI